MITTNVAYDPSKESKLSTKVSTKWSHQSGFTLEKLELANDGKVTTETSLTGAAKGLKLEFKGNDSDKGDLGFTYKHDAATITGEVDALGFTKANASICAGSGPITAGASADLAIAKASISKTSLAVGVAYTVPKSLFVGLRSSKNLSEHSGVFSFVAAPNMTVAGKVAFAKDTSGVLAAVYKCNPNTTIKVKAGSCGTLFGSVKQQLDKKFNVVGSAEVPSTLTNVKFGINATLG